MTPNSAAPQRPFLSSSAPDGMRLARASGARFLAELMRHLEAALGVEAAFTAELCGDRWERMRFLAYAGSHGPVAQEEFPLKGGPWETLGTEPRFYREGVARLFPHDRFLAERGFEGFAGIPLFDAQGRPLGILGCASTAPMDAGSRAVAYLLEFAERVTFELSSRRTVSVVPEILGSVGAPGASSSFGELARSLAHSLHARIGLVCELVPGETRQVRIRGLSVDGVINAGSEGQEIPVQGAPCEKVYRDGWNLIPYGMSAQFPEFTSRWRMPAEESYLGLVFSDRAGNALGHLVVIDDRPMREVELPQAPLCFFALRAGAELERERAEGMRLELERERLANQRMESLGLLAGGVAHDFNNLLVGILGNASLASASVRDDSTRALLGEIESAARRASDLATQLLAYAGRGALFVSAVDVSVMASEIGRLVRTSIPMRIDLRLDLDRGLPLVRGDATQLRQVVLNLVLNAADAIGDSAGVIQLVVRPFEADAAFLAACPINATVQPGSYVMLEVTDSGCGMDELTSTRIFDPFFSTKFTGRGLGLSSVRGIIRAHGGALWFTTRKGHGSTFRVLLPPVASETPGPQNDFGGTPRCANDLFLVVDDEELVRRSVVRMLKHLGYQTLEAADGFEAVDLLRAKGQNVRAVLLDMTMPCMSGDETLAALRAERPDVPVLLMSGYGEPSLRDGRSRGDFSGFIGKPFTLSELSTRVRAVLEA